MAEEESGRGFDQQEDPCEASLKESQLNLGQWSGQKLDGRTLRKGIDAFDAGEHHQRTPIDIDFQSCALCGWGISTWCVALLE